MDGQTATKETTILEETHCLRKQLDELSVMLDSNFNRKPEDCCGEKGEPVADVANVLDEIIKNLVKANSQLGTMIAFVQNNVLRKIS